MEDEEKAMEAKMRIIRTVAIAVKAANLFEAIVVGIRAVQESLTTLNPLIIAAAVAAAAANVAAIVATPLPNLYSPSAAGGSPVAPTVPGTGTKSTGLSEGALAGAVTKPSHPEGLDSPTHVVVNLDGKPILDYFGRASRDGRVLIDARAVVA